MENTTSRTNISGSLEHAIRTFLKFFDEEAKNEFNLLNLEFQDIRKEQAEMQSDTVYRCDIAQKFSHMLKNRYRDILPYDKNRIVLQNGDGYVNASPIFYPDVPTRYIASQAPLSSTLANFWTMVLEYNVKIIVMLCSCVENGMPKCQKYWADDEKDGDICNGFVVFVQEVHEFDEFVVRKLRVKRKEEEKECDQVVYQLQFLKWPDHGVPTSEGDFLAFIDLLEERRRHCLSSSGDEKASILVHCSAGCGRTGSLIAFDIIRQLLTSRKLKELNIKKLVMALRQQRTSMVQTPGQYLFLYKCVAKYCRNILMGALSDDFKDSNTAATIEDLSPLILDGAEKATEHLNSLLISHSKSDNSMTERGNSETEQSAVDVRF